MEFLISEKSLFVGNNRTMEIVPVYLSEFFLNFDGNLINIGQLIVLLKIVIAAYTLARNFS